MTPDVKKMRKVFEWCRTDHYYDQSVSFFGGSKRCFGGKVLELYYDKNPLKIHVTNYTEIIGEILGVHVTEVGQRFMHRTLTLDNIDYNIKYYEDQLKPKHNFKVDDYVIIKEKGYLDGRRGRVVDISPDDVRVRCNATDEGLWIKARDVIMEDKATSLLRFLHRTYVNKVADQLIIDLLKELDQQGM